MYKRILIIVFFTIIACSKKQDNLEKNFKETLIEYQEKFPIPSNSNKGQYVYLVAFKIINKDTMFILSRSSSGLIKGYRGYGIFEDKNLKPTYIYDEKNYSKNFVYDTIRNQNTDIFYANKSGNESYPPDFTYLIKKTEIKLIKIDTIWKHWD